MHPSLSVLGYIKMFVLGCMLRVYTRPRALLRLLKTRVRLVSVYH